MVPTETKIGRSFKGALLYYAHDKGALTDERVAFTHTENLPTNDPTLAAKVMAYTAMHNNELRIQSGNFPEGQQEK